MLISESRGHFLHFTTQHLSRTSAARHCFLKYTILQLDVRLLHKLVIHLHLNTIVLLRLWSSVWAPRCLLTGQPDADDAGDRTSFQWTNEEKNPGLYGCKGFKTGSGTWRSLLATYLNKHCTYYRIFRWCCKSDNLQDCNITASQEFST